MRHDSAWTVALIAAAVIAITPVAAQTDGKCSADTLSQALHERMGKEGKSDAEIRDILDSSMKRRILRGRVADGSGCTADQTEKALDRLAARVKQG